jgi:hypothetical protein
LDLPCKVSNDERVMNNRKEGEETKKERKKAI